MARSLARRWNPSKGSEGFSEHSLGYGSRIAVDRSGSIWITKSGMSRVVKIGLPENNQCVDRNGDGRITTSTRKGDVLGWKGGYKSWPDRDIAHLAED